jgi:hypothetical protein
MNAFRILIQGGTIFQIVMFILYCLRFDLFEDYHCSCRVDLNFNLSIKFELIYLVD